MNTVPSPKAKKSLGQNFLRDANIARKIVRRLDVEPHDSVLEIGPGPGALTAHILEAAPARLLLVEKDSHWARERAVSLAATFSGAQAEPMAQMPEDFIASGVPSGVLPGGPEVSPGVSPEVPPGGVSGVLEADALALPWERLPGPWKVIGNLPYNIASPFMWELFSRAGDLRRAVFMVQMEVGLRLAAKPITSAYGALSIWVQSFVRPELAFIVPPHVFSPKPKVDSAVLAFTPHPPGSMRFSPKGLARVLRASFQMRRKQLGTIFRNIDSFIELLNEMGVSPTLRPENLTVEQFHFLSQTPIFCR